MIMHDAVSKNIKAERINGHTMEGGHAKCFGVGVLEIIEASQGIVGETRSRSVNEVGALWVLKNLLEGAFHCGCG